VSVCAPVKKGEHNTKEQCREFYRSVKLPVLEASGFECAVCHKDVRKGAQLHHVLPWQYFSELEEDKRNLVPLCGECHNLIHNNPYMNIRFMEEKAEELGMKKKLSEVFGMPPYKLL
jgi:predicted HNH restriction endonuclease